MESYIILVLIAYIIGLVIIHSIIASATRSKENIELQKRSLKLQQAQLDLLLRIAESQNVPRELIEQALSILK